jgi:uncharacterized protein YcsI (UPF0317 family)
MEGLTKKHPREIRGLIRRGEFSRPTSGLAEGYVQANLAIVPRDVAFDFLLFCQRNPKPCPLLEALEPGQWEPKLTTPGADLRTDVPLYRVYQKGELVDEPKDLTKYWRDDLVSFLLGCSFTFDAALMRSGVRLRYAEENKNLSMYITNIQTVPAGVFFGPVVVSMRPIPRSRLMKTIQMSARYILAHGAPLHAGEPEVIGIKDINRPDFGERETIEENEVPVFWACGVTPQAIALKAKPALMITHSPGHMFLTDLLEEDTTVS